MIERTTAKKTRVTIVQRPDGKYVYPNCFEYPHNVTARNMNDDQDADAMYANRENLKNRLGTESQAKQWADDLVKRLEAQGY